MALRKEFVSNAVIATALATLALLATFMVVEEEHFQEGESTPTHLMTRQFTCESLHPFAPSNSLIPYIPLRCPERL